MPKSGAHKKQRTMPEFAHKGTPGGTARRLQDGGSGKPSPGGARNEGRESVLEVRALHGAQREGRDTAEVSAARGGTRGDCPADEEGLLAPCGVQTGTHDDPSSGARRGARDGAAPVSALGAARMRARGGIVECSGPGVIRAGAGGGAAGGSVPEGTPGGSMDCAHVPEEAMGEQSSEGNVAAILIELRRMLSDVAAAVDRLTVKVDSTCAQMAAFGTRMTEVEERVGTLEDAAGPTRNQILALERKVRDLEKRAEDMEGRSRRNNIRVIGLPEGHDPRGMEVYMETVLRAALPAAQLSQLFLIERAHRVPGTRPPVGADPRPVICRIFNYRDRDALLAAARVTGEVRHENVLLQLYPDYTLAVQQQRRQFGAAKKALRDKKLQYGMLYPSRLRVEHEGRTHFFTEPSAVFTFVESLGRRSPRTPSGGGGASPGERAVQEHTVAAGNDMQRLTDTIGAWEVRHSPGATPRRARNEIVTQALVHTAGDKA